MSPSHAGYGAYRRQSDRIMPRNQREAGIEYHQWEARLKPQRPWLSIVVITAAVIIAPFCFLAACAWAYDTLLTAGVIH